MNRAMPTVNARRKTPWRRTAHGAARQPRGGDQRMAPRPDNRPDNRPVNRENHGPRPLSQFLPPENTADTRVLLGRETRTRSRPQIAPEAGTWAGKPAQVPANQRPPFYCLTFPSREHTSPVRLPGSCSCFSQAVGILRGKTMSLRKLLANNAGGCPQVMPSCPGSEPTNSSKIRCHPAFSQAGILPELGRAAAPQLTVATAPPRRLTPHSGGLEVLDRPDRCSIFPAGSGVSRTMRISSGSPLAAGAWHAHCNGQAPEHLHFESDVRFMSGEFVGADGRNHHGAFAFI